MGTFFSTFGRHGFKVWLTYLLGAVITFSVLGIIWLIASFIGGILLFASTISYLEELDPESKDFLTQLEEIAPGAVLLILLFLLLMVLISLPFLSFLNAGLYSSVRQTVFENRFSFGTFFKEGFSNLWGVIKQSLLLCLLYSPLIVFLFFSVIFLLTDGLEMIGTVFLLISLIYFLFMTMGVMHAPAILVTEKTGAWKSVTSSFRLMFRSFGRVFLTLIAVIGSGIALSVLLILPVNLFAWIIADGDFDSPIAVLIRTPFERLFATFIAVFCTFVVFFRYQRVRPILFPGEVAAPQGQAAASLPPSKLNQPEPVQRQVPLSKPNTSVSKRDPDKEKEAYPSSPFKAIPYPEEDSSSR